MKCDLIEILVEGNIGAEITLEIEVTTGEETETEVTVEDIDLKFWLK